MDVADRLAVINKGRLEQVGTPAELYDNPVNDFVLTFVGPATTIGGEFVRPHDLAIYRTDALDPAPPASAHPATILRVVHLGFEVRVELQLDDGTATYAQVDRAAARELDLEVGQHVLIAPVDTGSLDPRGDLESTASH